MKKLLKILGIIVLVIVLLIGIFVVYVEINHDKKYNDTPYPDIKAGTDSALIARGKYLVYGPAHCAGCHTAVAYQADVEAGKEVPLIGGFEFKIPPGIFRPRNITPDKETGIGNLTDAEIARTLRYNVNSKGEIIAPFMPFQEMSDYDLTAIISYLRTIPPVHSEVKPTEYNLIGKAVRTLVFKPYKPAKTPDKFVAKDTTLEYGKYMATCVANCYGCHTNRSMVTGEFTGPALGGGLKFEPDGSTHGYAYIAPNLTPDEGTSRISGWDEHTFIARFKQGRIQKYSPMPWGSFLKMDETDLKAIYKYLRSVAAVKNEVKKTAFAPGEKLPE